MELTDTNTSTSDRRKYRDIGETWRDFSFWRSIARIFSTRSLRSLTSNRYMTSPCEITWLTRTLHSFISKSVSDTMKTLRLSSHAARTSAPLNDVSQSSKFLTEAIVILITCNGSALSGTKKNEAPSWLTVRINISCVWKSARSSLR